MATGELNEGAGVFPVSVGGKMPSAESVRDIVRAVDAIPFRFRARWLRAGGRLEIIYGDNARLHPDSRGKTPVLGWTELGGVWCCVAGDHPDSVRTAVHEIGHAVDHALGHVSRQSEWRRIWETDRTAGRVSQTFHQDERPEEYFAESFANLWTGNTMFVTETAGDFIAFKLL